MSPSVVTVAQWARAAKPPLLYKQRIAAPFAALTITIISAIISSLLCSKNWLQLRIQSVNQIHPDHLGIPMTSNCNLTSQRQGPVHQLLLWIQRRYLFRPLWRPQRPRRPRQLRLTSIPTSGAQTDSFRRCKIHINLTVIMLMLTYFQDWGATRRRKAPSAELSFFLDCMYLVTNRTLFHKAGRLVTLKVDLTGFEAMNEVYLKVENLIKSCPLWNVWHKSWEIRLQSQMKQ